MSKPPRPDEEEEDVPSSGSESESESEEDEDTVSCFDNDLLLLKFYFNHNLLGANGKSK